MNAQTICIASDHGGYELKEHIKVYLTKKDYTVKDFGCENKNSVHYPAYGKLVSEAVASGEYQYGILICTTGNGMAITANRNRRIRAGLCLNTDMAMLTRAHNNANILVMGQKYVMPELAEQITDTFLNTAFEGGRHQTRVEMMD